MRDGAPTRKRLERCALTLFVKKGITATTIKDIASKAGIAEGTLYRHYQSKDELAQTLYLRSYEEVSSHLKQLAEKHPTLEEKLKSMVHYFCDNYDQDPILFNYLLLAQHYQIRNIADKEISAHELMIPFFNDAIRKKELKKRDPHFYAAVVLGIVLQAAVSRVYGRITRSMTEDREDLIVAILAAIHS